MRRTARVRLADSRLQRVIDLIDIEPSLFQDFFRRSALGHYELESLEQFVGLLVTMVWNKVANPVSSRQAARRDCRTVTPAGPDGVNPAGNAANPCAVVAAGLKLSPEVLRKRFYRATARISRDLEIDEMDHG